MDVGIRREGLDFPWRQDATPAAHGTDPDAEQADQPREVERRDDDELFAKAGSLLDWSTSPGESISGLNGLPSGDKGCLVQLMVSNSTRSRLNEWGAFAWASDREPDLSLPEALAHMLAAAVRAGSMGWEG